jgi:hypothetical protein
VEEIFFIYIQDLYASTTFFLLYFECISFILVAYACFVNSSNTMSLYSLTFEEGKGIIVKVIIVIL